MTLAVGAILGTVIAPAIRRRVDLRPVVVSAAVGQAAALLAVGSTTNLTIATAAMAIVGAFNAAWNVVTVSYRQAAVPIELLFRVTGNYRVIALSAMPLGAAAGGITAHTWGLHAPYLASGIVLTAATLLAFPALQHPAPLPSTDR